MLRRVFDNEQQVPADEDMLTLPELISTISDSIWSEIDAGVSKSYTARQPMISSFRRNLQREYIDRLIDLSLDDSTIGAASSTIATLSTYKLRELKDKIGSLIESRSASRLDPYTIAHLTDAKRRIEKALDADYIYNAGDFGMGGSFSVFFGRSAE